MDTTTCFRVQTIDTMKMASTASLVLVCDAACREGIPHPIDFCNHSSAIFKPHAGELPCCTLRGEDLAEEAADPAGLAENKKFLRLTNMHTVSPWSDRHIRMQRNVAQGTRSATG